MQFENNRAAFESHGVVHGGVIYTMADTGMGAALYPCIETDESCATVQLDIHYFKAVYSGTLHCTTKLMHKTRKLATLQSEVRNKNSLIAKATGTYYIFKA